MVVVTDSLRYEDPQAYAMWCAAHTLCMQDVAAKLLEGASHYRLHYVPPRVFDMIRRIGCVAITGSTEDGALLAKILEDIECVRWNLVDPAVAARPIENRFGAPIYESGDVVPWKDGKADVIRELRGPAGCGRAARCGRLRGGLSRYRSDAEGLGIAPLGWFISGGGHGVELDKLNPGEPSF